MQNTLPNEPLQIVITEAGRDALTTRALLRQAAVSLVMDGLYARCEVALLIAAALNSTADEPKEGTGICSGCGKTGEVGTEWNCSCPTGNNEPEICSSCGGYEGVDCYCHLDYSPAYNAFGIHSEI